MKRPIVDDSAAIHLLRKYFYPLVVNNLPDKNFYREFVWEQVFHYSERKIEEYHVIGAFKIPGKLWITPTLKRTRVGNRSLWPGNELCIRRDAVDYNKIDVEVVKGDENQGAVYTLTEKEFLGMRRYLKLFEGQSQAHSRGGDLVPAIKMCVDAGCKELAYQFGLCVRHWSQAKKGK